MNEIFGTEEFLEATRNDFFEKCATRIFNARGTEANRVAELLEVEALDEALQAVFVFGDDELFCAVFALLGAPQGFDRIPKNAYEVEDLATALEDRLKIAQTPLLSENFDFPDLARLFEVAANQSFETGLSAVDTLNRLLDEVHKKYEVLKKASDTFLKFPFLKPTQEV